jgi:hypothetical protein
MWQAFGPERSGKHTNDIPGAAAWGGSSEAWPRFGPPGFAGVDFRDSSPPVLISPVLVNSHLGVLILRAWPERQKRSPDGAKRNPGSLQFICLFLYEPA